MKKLLCLILLFTFLAVSTSQECSFNGQNRLIGQYFVTLSFIDITGGVLEVCVDGTYYRVCANDSFATIDSAAGIFACNSIGYDFGSISLDDEDALSNPSDDAMVIDSISCPAGATNFSMCTFNLTSSEECASHVYDGSLACLRGRPPPLENCTTNGQFQLIDEFTIIIPSQIGITSGLVELCVNGTFYRVCANDTHANLDSITPSLICNSLGVGTFGFFEAQDSSNPSDGAIVDTVSCPNGATDLSMCSFYLTSMGECLSHDYDARITCFQFSGVCVDNQVQLDSPVRTVINDTIYLTGRPTVCVNNHYRPICSATSLTALDIATICAPNGFNLGSVGNTPGLMAPSLSNITNTTVVITNYSCSSYGNCSVNSVSPNSDCADYGNDYITITCQNKVCQDFDGVQLHNSNTIVADGATITTGIPRGCSNGAYTVLCNDRFIHPSYAVHLCQSAGYQNGIGLPSNSNLHGSSLIGSTLYYSLLCPDDYVDFDDCNVTTPTNPLCYTGELDYVVQCDNSTRCSGSGYRLFNNRTEVVNGATVISGIPVNCSNGFLFGLCRDGTVDSQTPDIICNQLGYNGGNLVKSNATLYGGVPANTIILTNLDCPMDSKDLERCTTSVTANPLCYSGELTYVIQCSASFSVGAAIGVSIGVIILVLGILIALSVFGIVFMYIRKKSSQDIDAPWTKGDIPKSDVTMGKSIAMSSSHMYENVNYT